MRYNDSTMRRIRAGRARFISMAATYCLGVFNDNFFKEAAILLAVVAGRSKFPGTATFLFSLPYVVFSAYAGWMADRFPKRNVVIWAKLLELAAMIIGAIGIVTLNWNCIIAMVFLMALQSTIFGPALNGSIPELYPEVYVPQANSFIRAVTTVAILLGMMLAGIALDQDWMELTVPFGNALVAVVVVLVALAGVVASFGGHRKAPSGKPRSFPWAGPLNSLKNLFDLKRDPQLLLAISGSTFFYFISLLAVLVIKTLGLKQLGFSFTETSLLSGSLMVGVGIGSLIAGKMVSIERWTRFLVPSAAGMGLGLILAGMVPAFPREIQLWSLFVFFTLTGACGGMFLIPIASFIQVRPAPDEKGKIIGVSNFASFGFMMVSGVLFTWLDPLWSPGTIMSALGAFTVLAAGLLALFLFGGKLLDWTLAFTTRRLLALRYRIEVSGLETIRKKGTEGILFLPNHPALIDPLIVTSQLFTDFRPRPMADRDQSDRPLIKQVLRRLRAIIIPDLTKVGQQGSEAIQEALGEVIDGLKQKDTILLYPSGRIYRSCLEEIGGNSAVEQIVKNVPDCRVVLVRTRGLWGSTFGHAGGHAPKVGRNILLYLASAVWNLVFFIPRRQVTIEFIEPEDFPRTADRLTINGYLETFYNEDALPNTFVPYIWWQGYRPQIRPEPARKTIEGDASRVPETTRKLVIDFLTETTGVSGIEDDHSLSRDLGMDSLTLLELMSWMGQEFGLPQEDLEALQTVGDCLLAACGEMVGRKMAELKPVPAAWFKDPSDQRLSLPEGKNIGEVFLAAARRSPGAMLAADQMSGALTYRRLVAGVMALKKAFDVLPGDTLGIMLPASVSATMTYLAVMFSGKTPVMVNWTVGEGHMAYCLRQTGVTRVITARLLLERLKGRGFDPGKVDVEWVFLEDIVRGISWVQKLVLLVKSYCSWQSLARVKLSKTACVLFTSGSEANPKAVPLTHANILVNIRDFISVLTFKADDRLLGMLPPFHSLGLTGTVIMPCVIGLRIVYHSDPTAAVALARLIELYKSTQLVGTPTFLNGIVRAASPEQLESLRLVVTGAEKCPDYVYAALDRACPNAMICEGYGITECSPAVCLNREDDPRPGTIGKVLPSMEYMIVDPDTGNRVSVEEQGMLLVRGPNVFSGYLGTEAKSPFVELDGRHWYRTGDLVSESEDGFLTFRGRLKRFIKLGGEMISLPAIEAVLGRRFTGSGDEGPMLAVEATPSEDHPEIVLFTSLDLSREEANRIIREDGLSALHNIRRIVKLEEIPVLGTGKTDYRTLKEMLQTE